MSILKLKNSYPKILSDFDKIRMKELKQLHSFPIVKYQLALGKNYNEIMSMKLNLNSKIVQEIIYYYHHNLYNDLCRNIRPREELFSLTEEQMGMPQNVEIIYPTAMNLTIEEQNSLALKFNAMKPILVLPPYSYESLSADEKEIYKKL